MKSVRIARFAPDWLLTYAGVILLVSILVNLVTTFAQFTHNLTLPSMRDSLDMSYTQAGILVTGGAAVRMVSSLIFGTLAPRYGSRIIIGITTIGAGVSMFFLGVSPSFTVALVAMGLLGFTSAGALTPMMGLIAPWFDVRNRGLAAGITVAGGSLAIVAMGALVPWLTDRSPIDGWRHTWYLFGAVSLVFGVLALIFTRDRPKDASATRGPASYGQVRGGAWPMEAYRNRLVWLVTGLAFCSGWTHGIFFTFFGSYLSEEGIDLAIAGRLLILMGVLSVGSGILWGRASDVMDRGRAFMLSFSIQAVTFALFWLVPVLGAFVVASVLMGFTLRASYAICTACAGDYVTVQFSAAAFALMSVGAGLGHSLSPVTAGAIADAADTLSWAFALAMVGSLLGMVGGYVLSRSSKPYDS